MINSLLSQLPTSSISPRNNTYIIAMPFFSSRRPEEEVHEEPAPMPEKKHSIFGSRHRSPSPTTTSRTRTSTSSSRSDASSNPSRNRSVLSRTFGHGSGRNVELDPSIVQARERVMNAENAERDADRALEAARLRVREARNEVKRLELEAAEEARLAKIKQYHAKEVSKRGKHLGRTFLVPSPLRLFNTFCSFCLMDMTCNTDYGDSQSAMKGMAGDYITSIAGEEISLFFIKYEIGGGTKRCVLLCYVLMYHNEVTRRYGIKE
ncbi:hypothetical protein RRF57_012149 [Xylaria bambusicola]|uniref:Uncharacterized protein n=1 Tax=Xylaria bambusicola TaxID=326684 RepID=A0AAN7ZAP0_9PEZI